jgi:hypothetical protein
LVVPCAEMRLSLTKAVRIFFHFGPSATHSTHISPSPQEPGFQKHCPPIYNFCHCYKETLLKQSCQYPFFRLPKTRCEITCARLFSSSKHAVSFEVLHSPQKTRCNYFYSALMSQPDVPPFEPRRLVSLTPTHTRLLTTVDPASASPDPSERTTRSYD